jgi:hypothetical protein
MSEFSRISAIERTNILTRLVHIPPDEYLAYCDTVDRLECYIEIKTVYTALMIRFQSVWMGQKVLDFPGIDSEFLTLFQREHMRFYELIQNGWGEIEAEFDRKGIDLSTYATSPGHAFCQVLIDQATAVFAPCVEAYYRSSPERHRKWRALVNSISKETDSQNKIALEKKLEVMNKQEPKHIRAYMTPKLVFIDICREASKRNKGLKAYLRDYDQAVGDLNALVESQHHPRKHVKGWQIDKGTRKPLS